MTDKDKICDGNNLYQAYKDTIKTSSWKPQAQDFEINVLFELSKLQKELQEEIYKTSAKSEFVLHERGKTRLIRGAQFRDRLVRHVLCDNILEPALYPLMIYDNCASIKGKGIDMSRRRFRTHLEKFYRKYGSDGYILLMDFSGYYDNIRHDLLKESIFARIKDDYSRKLISHILEGFEQDVSYLSDKEVEKLYYGKYKALEYVDIPKKLKTGKKFLKKSVDIGDQCSQILSVYYPTRIDNYIKIVCGEKFYARYMDDSYLMHPSKEHLLERLKEIKEIADEMGIILNPNKVRICKLTKQFTFLQHKYFLTGTGKIVERLNPKRITTMRRKLKKLSKKVAAKELDINLVVNMFNSWKPNHYPYMSKVQRRNLDELFKNLFIKNKEEYGV